MKIVAFFRRLSRGLARFNDSFGGAVVAASTQPQNQTTGADPGTVTAILGEIAKSGREGREGREGPVEPE